MSAPRALDSDGMFRRIDALDALYLNWDRRREEFLALDLRADPDAFAAALAATQAAWRAYEAMRATPYRLEER